MPEHTRKRHTDHSHILVSTDQIQLRVGELARQISQDYGKGETLLLVGILRGAFIFLADLSRQLSVPNEIDFMAVSSYGKNTSPGEVRIVMDLRESVEGKHILLVEDIVDSGKTLDYLYRVLQTRQPASLRTCVMVRKKRHGLESPIDYLGFEIPDVWVVGYGLDYAGHYRTLPYIAELKD